MRAALNLKGIVSSIRTTAEFSQPLIAKTSSRRWVAWAVMLVLLAFAEPRSSAYSVLTHEEIIDLVWVAEIKPLLLARYPGLTDDQFKEAHAYAYGGAVIQDLGYYPFGSTEFSDLAHYVRSGDFVVELIRESQDVNEYAFALGALAHYASDVDGHPAVNRSVAIEYPKLRAKFGPSVRYAQGKAEHLKTEFGFDAAQVAKQRYASPDYHDFIGFNVSKPLLERAFPVVYGMELKEVLAHEDLAIGSYRYAVSQLIPKMTQVALHLHKKDLIRERPDFAQKKFLYRISRADYEREWGKGYTRPDFGVRLLALLLRLIPKVGPFRGLAFNNPTPATEDLYFKSINTTVDHYREFLEQVRAGKLVLPDRDLDTGNEAKATEYSLTDSTYATFLGQLADRKFEGTSTELRANILGFYSDLTLPITTKADPAAWQKVLTELDALKAASLVPAPSPAKIP